MKQGWHSTKLQNIFEVKYGKGLPKRSRHSDGSVKVFGSNGRIGIHSSAITSGPTIIIGRKGSVGEVNYSPAKCWPIDTTYYVDDFPCDLPPKYWTLYLKSLPLGDKEKSTAIPGINREDLYSLEILVPPINEQRRIVAKLEKLLHKVDACKERLDKIPTILKRFRQSILAAACSGRLTEDWREAHTAPAVDQVESDGLPNLPPSWCWRRIGALFTVETGTTPPKKDVANYSDAPTEYPFFKPTDLDAGWQVREAREWLSKRGEKAARHLPPMTVCVTSIGATIGKTGLLRVRGATNQQVNSIVPSKAVRSEFTFFFCCSPYFQRRIVEEASSTTLPIINKSRFQELEFPLPPISEQHEIVRRVEALFKIADQIEERYKKARAYVDKLSQSILAKAFRGELVPQDPNDEPASELLKRIKEEQAKKEGKIKTGSMKRKKKR